MDSFEKKIRKIEAKCSKYCVPHLTIYVIACFVIGYILRYAFPEVYSYMLLLPGKIVENHQYWRLITWIFSTPSGISIFTLIMLFFYYSIGTQLENTWGKFMYNLYIIGGILLISIAVLVVSLIIKAMGHADFLRLYDSYAAQSYLTSPTYYIQLSMFLAFAAIYSDTRVMLYFIIPIKIKWLAYLDLAFLAYYCYVGDVITRTIIIAGVVNFFIYFFINKTRNGRSLGDMKRKRDFDKKVKGSNKARNTSGPKVITPDFGNAKGITVHKCAICGKTEKDGAELEFRFCSKCNGNYEYCKEHLYTHKHVL